MDDAGTDPSDDDSNSGRAWYEWLGCFVNGCALVTGGSSAALGLLIWWGVASWPVS